MYFNNVYYNAMGKIKTLLKLKPAKEIKHDFYVFDTETVKRNGNKLKYDLRAKPDAFYFGVVYGNGYKKVIESVEEFKAEFLKPMYKGKKVFAHNLAYDLGVLYDNIFLMDNKAVFNGKLICATNGNCTFADSMNIYQTSVKKLGALLNLNKQELTGNTTRWFDGSKGIPENDIKYCVRDCEIVYNALIEAFEFSGEIKITQASLSLAYFKRYQLEYNIKHNPSHTKYFYDSYYGGRTECFKMGKTKARVYDVNSMYPYAMHSNPFPNPNGLSTFKIKDTSNPAQIKKFLRLLKRFEGMATLTVKHAPHWLGFLPVRHDKKLIFPIGIFKGSWNFPEIRYALKAGIIEILEVHLYSYSAPIKSPFKKFVDTLYKSRFESNDSFEIFRIKIFMNSLYGKLAQRVLEESTYIENIESAAAVDIIEQAKKDKTFIKLSLFNMERNDAILTTKSKRGESLPYSIPSFSSYVTTYGRIQLLDKLVNSVDNLPVYCDTDSIFVEHEIKENTPHVDKFKKPILGAWKLEDKLVTNIRGLKNYEYIENGIDKRALKGVPKTAKEIRRNVWEYYNLVKSKEALRRGIESGVLIKRTKVLKEEYTKRVVNSDGTTKPINLLI